MHKKHNRRHFLKQAGLLAGFTAVGAAGLPTMNASASDLFSSGRAPQAQDAKPWYSLSVIGDPLMDERLIYYLGHSWFRMADIGECLDTASRIEAGNPASWRKEWFRTADRLRKVAETSLAMQHDLSAGESYLRAASYYLAGLIYADTPTDPEVPRTARASAECFEAALKLLDIPATPVNIPYEQSSLPGYFFTSPLATKPAPILIVHEGMDASVEECLFLAQESIKRGYHCLLFHHPGQGLALRERGLTFRPDWEKVITPVVDYVLTRPEVDPARISLTGLSFGGALVTRAMAFEKRVKICIANPAMYSWADFFAQFFFADNPDFGKLLESDPDAFNAAVVGFLQQAPPYYTWWFNSASWKYGASSAADLLTKLKSYTNADIAQLVTCHMLVMDGEGESWGAGHAKRLYDALTCPKDYMLFTAEDTGLLHNQNGALSVSSQRMFDWLDEHI
ncbi:MAG: alpha/beta fold hydrolase [Anaerolineae bacterium]|nr:alpha/beta fold hydrolase [Anaerolineae bacterium]